MTLLSLLSSRPGTGWMDKVTSCDKFDSAAFPLDQPKINEFVDYEFIKFIFYHQI